MKKVIVIGAGAAGLMASGQAALSGAEVVLVEKMPRPARKLRISGKGRGNLTNAAPLAVFLEHFGSGGRFMRSVFTRFFSEELIEFFEEIGIETQVEEGGRIFPVSGKAGDVVDALEYWVKSLGVDLRLETRVQSLEFEGARFGGVRVKGGCKNQTKKGSGEEHLGGDAVILATGGASYPATGSSGDGYWLAKQAGHTIIPTRPALVPLETKGDIASRIQGLALKNVSVMLLVDGKIQAREFGEMLFTHFGLSGPIVLKVSKVAVDALAAGRQVAASIDLKPALDEKKLEARLQRDFDAHGKMKFRNILKDLLPQSLIEVCQEQTGVSPDKNGCLITALERRRLCLWLKDFRFDISGYRSWEEAIITAGGVSLSEVDPRTMSSRLKGGLYFAGEVLDIDADTGGYNLQAAFSTGWLAGKNAIRKKNKT